LSVAAASAAGVFATSCDDATCGTTLETAVTCAGEAGAGTVTMLETFAGVMGVLARGVEIRATLGRGEGREGGMDWVGMGEIAAVGMIFFGMIDVEGCVGGGSTRLLLKPKVKTCE
jgi:hypothetical protein